MEKIIQKVSKMLGILEKNVESTYNLYDSGATIPFISRYRKEVTGGLNEEQIKDIIDKINYEIKLEERKQEVIRLIEEQGKLTEELKNDIIEAQILQKVEDLYLPYKKKKKTKADIAIEKGLEPLAKDILYGLKLVDLENRAKDFLTEEVLDTNEAIQLSYLILAQYISEDIKIREYTRDFYLKKGIIQSNLIEKNKELDSKLIYKDYYNFSQEVSKIVSYRVLALDRAEKEKVLKVDIFLEEKDLDYLEKYIYNHMFKKSSNDMKDNLIMVIKDSCTRLLFPSIENEIRNILTENAQDEAINIFQKNLQALLLQPPLYKKTVLGLDPGIRTGTKLVVVSKEGFYLVSDLLYTVKGANHENQIEKSKEKLRKYIQKYDVDIIAIGNGTASRETESFVSEAIKGLDCKFVIVNEAGASVYSASKIAKEEFPDLDVTERGTISIARRIQDPLAELVKIDPKSIGVGMYQHDVNQKKLEQELTQTVEKIVNHVGVNINTASYALLSYVSGIKKNIAKNIVDYRKENGDIKNRKEILKIKGIGDKAYEQLAGFVVIPESDNPFDNTIIHPESYKLASEILALVGSNEKEFKVDYLEIRQRLSQLKQKDVVNQLSSKGYGVDTIIDVLEALLKDRRDPRDNYDAPILKSDILTIEDLKVGMILEGTVRNVAKFGAFVDIGLKNDAMIHISELSDKYIKDPTEVLQVGQIIKVRILNIDKERQRVGLSRKDVK